MEISESTNLNEEHQITSLSTSTTRSIVKVCVNGLIMSKARIADESSITLSIYEYVADNEDILGHIEL